ncbi:kinase-like protein [Paxillus ammoniavirescens]|nr:kinase-like protein [Paxillus ammoniavirescens]
MVNIRCMYCDKLMPQSTHNAHVRENHSPPTAQDMANIAKKYYPKRRQQTTPSSHQAVAPNLPVRASTSDAIPTGSAPTPVNMSTGFSAWVENHSGATSHNTPYITTDDVSSFRVDRSDQPQTTVQLLRKSTKFDVQELVRGFGGLQLEEREECIELVGNLPVFPALGVYVLTHLKLCAPDKPSVLYAFRQKVEDWIKEGEEWCLLNYSVIKNCLTQFLEESQVDRHKCNEKLLNHARVHTSDIHNLGGLVAMYAVDENRVESFYSMKGDQAQSIIDLLQALLNLESDQFDSWYRRRFLDAVIRLSKKSRHYPQCLKITGVDDCAATNDRGGFGAIFQGKLLGKVVALKELQAAGRTTDRFLKDFCQEAVVWRNVHHINCLPFYGVATVNDGAPRTCLVSPWMENGNLCTYLINNPDAPRLPLLLDIASGLEYLHTMQPTIVHGDLKGLNIFVTSSKRACLADFGLATAHDAQVAMATTTYGVSGTPGYMAPELMEAGENPSLLSRIDRRRCDIFAFGCIAYEVFTGAPPFANNPTMRSHYLRIGDRPPRPNEERISRVGLDDDMWDFIDNLWKQRPEVRLVAESAKAFLRYKLSTVAGESVSRSQADPEWDIGFLSGLVVASDPFAL